MRAKPNATPDDLAFGVNACAMALKARAAKRLLYFEGTRNERVHALAAEAARQGLPVESVDGFRLDELTGEGVHQGVLVRLHKLPGVDLRRVARESKGPSLVILLDHIMDPQNLGSVLRTAVAVGADAVVTPPRRGASLTPGVHRASAGLSFLAPVATPQNLAQAVRELKEDGYWIVAADAGEDAQDATVFDWPQKTALILGSEGDGVSHLLRRESDFVAALPMDARVESLNVGVACGALAYLWRRQWAAAAAGVEPAPGGQPL